VNDLCESELTLFLNESQLLKAYRKYKGQTNSCLDERLELMLAKDKKLDIAINLYCKMKVIKRCDLMAHGINKVLGVKFVSETEARASNPTAYEKATSIYVAREKHATEEFKNGERDNLEDEEIDKLKAELKAAKKGSQQAC
jgi:hypothetical protein